MTPLSNFLDCFMNLSKHDTFIHYSLYRIDDGRLCVYSNM